MDTLIMNTPLVSVDWLANNIEHPDLIILDASIKKVTVTSNQVPEQNIQITGARFFDIKKSFSDLNTTVPNMLASPEVFEKNCRKLGINSNSKIVIYDTLGIYSSPRAWWMFTAMGYDTVSILNGGLPAWLAAGFSTEIKHEEATYPTGNFTTNDRSKCMKNIADVTSGMTDTNTLILDARSAGRYNGTAPEPRTDLKSGHIPNSISLPYTDVLDNGHVLPKEQLKTIFDRLEINTKNLIFTCGSGITACIILLAAKLSGYENLSVYDGSWSEWGLLDNMPIEC